MFEGHKTDLELACDHDFRFHFTIGNNQCQNILLLLQTIMIIIYYAVPTKYCILNKQCKQVWYNQTES